MPNIKSAKKRVKVNEKKFSENRSAKSELATAIKKFKTVALTADLAATEKLFPITVSMIDSAAGKGLIHKNNASGKVSDISKLLRDLRAGKITAPVVEPKKSKLKKEDAAKTPKATEVKTDEKAAKKTAAKAVDEKPVAKKAEAPVAVEEKAAKKPAAKKAEAPIAAEEKAAKKPAAKKAEAPVAVEEKAAKKPAAKKADDTAVEAKESK